MKHIHHIIPKHAGGTDDADNLIELTVEEHALAHKQLYEQYGRTEDRLAWLGLSKQIGKAEIFKETSSLGGRGNKGIPKSKEHRQKISKATKGKPQTGGVKLHTDEAKSTISSKMESNKNSSKHSSSEYKQKQSAAMKAAWSRRRKTK